MGAILGHHQLLMAATGGSVTDPFFANVSALLHFEGANGGTTFTDQTGKTWAVGHGTPTTTTSQSKFGTSSGVFTRSAQSQISTASNAGFGFGSGDFTIEAWIRLAGATGVLTIFESRTASLTGVQFFVDGVVLGASSNTAQIGFGSGSPSMSPGSWFHVALCRSGSTLRAFIGGVQSFSVTDSRTYAASAPATIGGDYANSPSQFFDGWIDDLRVTKGIARYTAAFTPPVARFPDS